MGNLPWFVRTDYYYDVREKKYYYLSQEEWLPAFVYTFASVNAGEESAWIRMDERALDLETEMDHLFFQYFYGVKKKGYIYTEYPVGEQIHTTDKLLPTAVDRDRSYVDNKISPFFDPDEMTEFFMRKGMSIAFKYYNTEDVALVQQLRFIGKKFRREEVVDITGLTPEEVEKIPKHLRLTDEIKAKARPLPMRRIA